MKIPYTENDMKILTYLQRGTKSNISAIEKLAAYKLTDPEKRTHERMRSFGGLAVAGATAAYMHGIGDLHPNPYEIAAPRRFNSRMDDARFPIKPLSEADIAWKSGIPVMRVEATIASLAEGNEDASWARRGRAGAGECAPGPARTP